MSEREKMLAQKSRMDQIDYSVDLQRIIEDLCHGLTIREPKTGARHHYDMAVASRSAATPAPGYAQGFEACRDAMAEAMWRGELRRAAGKERNVPWSEIAKEDQERWLYLADAAIAALPVPAGVGDWQPIETAPKDMTEVIVLCGPKDVRLGWYFAPSSRTFGWLDQRQKPITPTHWKTFSSPTILAKPAQEGHGS